MDPCLVKELRGEEVVVALFRAGSMHSHISEFVMVTKGLKTTRQDWVTKAPSSNACAEFRFAEEARHIHSYPSTSLSTKTIST